jgi:hypothetical protein
LIDDLVLTTSRLKGCSWCQRLTHVLCCLLSIFLTFHMAPANDLLNWMQACADKLDHELATYGCPSPCFFEVLYNVSCDLSHLLQACADKLDRELATYGCPPQFPTNDEDEQTAAAAAAQAAGVSLRWLLACVRCVQQCWQQADVLKCYGRRACCDGSSGSGSTSDDMPATYGSRVVIHVPWFTCSGSPVVVHLSYYLMRLLIAGCRSWPC